MYWNMSIPQEPSGDILSLSYFKNITLFIGLILASTFTNAMIINYQRDPIKLALGMDKKSKSSQSGIITVLSGSN